MAGVPGPFGRPQPASSCSPKALACRKAPGGGSTATPDSVTDGARRSSSVSGGPAACQAMRARSRLVRQRRDAGSLRGGRRPGGMQQEVGASLGEGQARLGRPGPRQRSVRAHRPGSAAAPPVPARRAGHMSSGTTACRDALAQAQPQATPLRRSKRAADAGGSPGGPTRRSPTMSMGRPWRRSALERRGRAWRRHSRRAGDAAAGSRRSGRNARQGGSARGTDRRQLSGSRTIALRVEPDPPSLAGQGPGTNTRRPSIAATPSPAAPSASTATSSSTLTALRAPATAGAGAHRWRDRPPGRTGRRAPGRAA